MFYCLLQNNVTGVQLFLDADCRRNKEEIGGGGQKIPKMIDRDGRE